MEQNNQHPAQEELVQQLASLAQDSEQATVMLDAVEQADQLNNAQNRIVEESDIIHPDEVPEKLPEVKKEVTQQEVRKQQKITISEPFTRTGTWDPDGDTVTLPANFDQEIRHVVDSLPNVNLLNDAKTREWAQTVSEGLELTTYGEAFVETLEDEQANFHQHVDVNGTKLAGQQPKLKPIENQSLKGERAAIRLMSHLGLGTLFQVPLWHSGFWITFKAPTESEIVELNRLLVSDKIQFGRHSYGLAFANTSAYTVERLVNFALDHIYDTTLKSDEVPTNQLINMIDCQDIPSLLWGFVCTMYPRGFQYRRACINEPEKCNHIVEELLNVTKLQWVNTNALTEWQKIHMSLRRSNSKDLASIKRYKEELSKTQKRKITFNKNLPSELFMTLKTPTIAQYIDAGHRWVGEMVEIVNKALGMDAKDTERNNMITRHGQATAMRQYVHWVESIEIGANIIDDGETIDYTFNTLTADNGIRNAFIEEVVKYINHSTIAVIGIPVFDCPVCAKPQDVDMGLPAHKNVIPVDVNQLFFDLLTQRLAKLTER